MTRKVELLNEWEASEEYETITFHDWLAKRIAELEKENAGLVEESGIDLVKYEEQLAEKNAHIAELEASEQKWINTAEKWKKRAIELLPKEEQKL